MALSRCRVAHTKLKTFLNKMCDGTAVAEALPRLDSSHLEYLESVRRECLEREEAFRLHELMSAKAIIRNAVLKAVTEDADMVANIVKYVMYYREKFNSNDGLTAGMV